MTRSEKDQIIEKLQIALNENPNFYITDTSGLNATQTTKLREMCFKREVKLMVVKNTLLKKAMEKAENNYEDLYEVLKETSALMFAVSGNAPAKLIKDFRKDKSNEKPLLKGAYIEETVYLGEDQLDLLENLKSKQDLIGDIILLLQSPVKNVISSLQSGGQKLSGIIKTLSEKPE